MVVNNAGIMAHSYSKTVDGVETQFGTNHVGHFLLTNLLLKGGLLEGGVRVVNVSSAGFRWGGIRFEDTDFDVSDSEYFLVGIVSNTSSFHRMARLTIVGSHTLSPRAPICSSPNHSPINWRRRDWSP